MEWPVSGVQSTYIYQVCCLLQVCFMAPQNSYNSNIKDHWSQITIINILIMKKFKILWKLPKHDTGTQSEPMLLEKWCPETCLMQSFNMSHFQYVKMQNLQSTIKSSAIEWGMLILIFCCLCFPVSFIGIYYSEEQGLSKLNFRNFNDFWLEKSDPICISLAKAEFKKGFVNFWFKLSKIGLES